MSNCCSRAADAVCRPACRRASELLGQVLGEHPGASSAAGVGADRLGPAMEAAGDQDAAAMNALPKYVASRTLTEATWNATITEGDVAKGVAPHQLHRQTPARDRRVDPDCTLEPERHLSHHLTFQVRRLRLSACLSVRQRTECSTRSRMPTGEPLSNA
ncbi:hypothetical protein E1286_13935 [Nonomuraea terrae]|uniref:Uncharacterized protein n=1 Tax=Nonomuraea terrae TaxID=2530383 RepID=A0A4R4YVA3_9ACTN|nr:hypothetical protein E1286_13935 [Nonomuraea terrae]